jgi:hypothetical protein
MCRGAAISRAQTDGTYINSLVRMFLATAMCRVFDVKITKVEADVPYWDVTVYVYQERYDGPILRDIRPVIMRMSVIQVIPENGREYALAILDYGVQIGSPVRRGSDPGGLGFAFEVEGESVESATQAPTPSATAPSMTPDLTPSTSRASVAL